MTRRIKADFHEHPSGTHLKGFAEGRLGKQLTEQISKHVELCDQCAHHVSHVHVDIESILFQPQLIASPPLHLPTALPKQIALQDSLEIQEVLGSGGMGVVYRAWQPNVRRYVAVKQLHVPLPEQDPGSLLTHKRFEREVRALGSVRHPHLAKIYSSGITREGRLYYSMELIDGANLASVFQELTEPQSQETHKLTWHTAVKLACGSGELETPRVWKDESHIRTVVNLIRQIATAVQTLHSKGIVHRDIKPSNIMVSAAGDHATLIDLGLAGLLDDGEIRLTRSGSIVGSLPYISPEQFRGVPPSMNGDIYNLGAVLWELLSLQRLFQSSARSSEAETIHRILYEAAGPIRAHQVGVSADLEAITLKCLEKQPSSRYASVSDFIDDIDRYIEGQKVAAVRQDSLFKVRSFLQLHGRWRNRIAALVMVQALFLAAVVLVRNFKANLGDQTPANSIGSSTLFSSASMVTSAVINDDSLVAWWSAEGNGSTAADRSSNRHNGALVGNTTRDTGVIGNAYSFDGNGDYINFGRSSLWNFLHDGSSFTVTAFVAPAASNMDGGILSTIDETSTAEFRHGFSLRLDGFRRPEIHIQGVSGKFPTGAAAKTELTPGVFSAIAVTFDGVTTHLYVNGEHAASGDVVAEFASSTALDGLSMGAIGTTSGPNGRPFSPFEGLIDEVQIYSRALSPSEIAFLSGKTSRPDSNIINVVDSDFFADGGAANGTSISATHNGLGMADTSFFPAAHAADPKTAFLTASSRTASLHYDFGAELRFSRMRLWNYHGETYGVDGNGRGVKRVQLFGSNEQAAFRNPSHASWHSIAVIMAARAPADGTLTPYGEEHCFEEHSFRYARLQVESNYGGEIVGLAEVQFLGPTSHPVAY